MTDKSAVSIALLFPDLLGTYGDGGNAIVLQKRLKWRGVEAEILTIDAGETVPETCDLYLLGGGEDGPQVEAARSLGTTNGPLHRAVEHGSALLAVCAGMQIIGRSFPDKDGNIVAGLGLLDCETVKTDERRAVGELLVEARPSLGLAPLTGFENHGGRTRLGAGAAPLGDVSAGVGNGDRSEGVMPADPNGAKVLGTYLHGPALARNPALADFLLSWALGTPVSDFEPVDDHEAELLRADRFTAIEKGRLDGVASRSWRDRLLGRN